MVKLRHVGKQRLFFERSASPLFACDLELGQLPIDVCTDSPAAVGVTERKSVIGKLGVDGYRAQSNWQDRHIDQQIRGDLNPSDMLTKGVVPEDFERHLGAMHMYVCSGRASELRSAVMVEQASGGLYPAPAVWLAALEWNA